MEEKQLEIESKSSMEFSLYEVIKRLIDVIGSIMGLILLSPIFLIVAIAIKSVILSHSILIYINTPLYLLLSNFIIITIIKN